MTPDTEREPSSTPLLHDECREAFQKWMTKNGVYPWDDDYLEGEAWQGWKASWNTRPAPTVPEWRPIESAPRDGTGILCWSDELYQKPYIAWFGEDLNAGENDGEEWLTGDGDDFSTGSYFTPCKPTHWMPLPSAPENKGGK